MAARKPIVSFHQTSQNDDQAERLACRWPVGWRCLLAVAVLVVVHAGTRAVDSGYEPEQIRVPEHNVGTLPLEVGDWSGEDSELDPRLFQAIGTDLVVNRRYQDSFGREVMLHAAAWRTDQLGAPHPPEGCYRFNGWEIVGRKKLELNYAGRNVGTARLLSVERDGRRLHVMYWYQLGPATFLDTDGMRDARRNLFGRPTWPPLTKVLLQMSAPTADLAEEHMANLAAEVRVWLDGAD